MINKSYKIGSRETGCLIINLLTYKLFTGFPSVYPINGGTAAHLSALLSAAAAILIIYVILRLYRRFDTDNIITAAERLFGGIGKYAAGAFLALYIAAAFVYSLREFSGLVKMLAFPTAPVWFVATFFAAAVIFSSMRGINSIIRAHTLVIPAAVAVTALMLASVLRYCEPENLFPVLGNGLPKILCGVVRGIPMYSDIILIFLINPFAADPSELKHTALRAAILAAVINLAFIIIYTMAIPFPVSAQADYPLYLLLKEVYYGRFFQRIDAIYMLTAALCGMLYLSFAASLLMYTLKQVFGMKSKRALPVPTAVALFLAALDTSVFGTGGTYSLVLVLSCAAPAALFAVALGTLITDRGGRKNAKA